MRILMVTAEYAPLAKVGGLGDAVASLARALSARGHDVRVVLPFYGDLDRDDPALPPDPEAGAVPLRLAGRVRTARFRRWRDPGGPTVHLLEQEDLFGRAGIYGYGSVTEFSDTVLRLALHAQGALALPDLLGWMPDVIHAHDAASALAVVDHVHWYEGLPGVGEAGTLLTIHNLAHQSLHPRHAIEQLDLPPGLAWYPGPLEFHGGLNLLKGGILHAGRVNTVSPTYAREVVRNAALGCGLGPVLADRGDDFSGILNGMDTEVWNPAADPHLPAAYDRDDLAGKETCRNALCAEMGLDAAVPWFGLKDRDGPILGIVGRLVTQKGYDLLLPELDAAVAAGWRVAVLGTGDESVAAPLRAAAAAHPGRVALAERFDEGLAHRIIAGSDLFLMPSRFEPCGLTQMYALVYGTVPIVRHTGGLADTVPDLSLPDGVGLVFEPASPGGVGHALERAGALWPDAAAWRTLQRRGMACDFGWDGPAASYEELYADLAPQHAERA